MAGTLPYGADVHDPLLLEDQEAAEAAREIKACLTISETSKALLTCDRMLSLYPHNKLFEGLRLEAENKEREARLEFIRRLSTELETEPDLDERIRAIQQALNRYPTESQLAQLLHNATARRDLFNSLIAEARNEELADSFAASLRQWNHIRQLYPTMPGLQSEIHRVESLADSQRRMKRRAEFVDAIFGLSSTGDYARAVYQCINALTEYPSDEGLLNLKKSIEEKALHSTELQTFISEGLTFLQDHEVDAALESFAKARDLDAGNLQVRYLIGIALLEKGRIVMSNDRRKLSLLLDEARNFIPNHPQLQTLSFDLEGMHDESFEKSLVRISPRGIAEQPDAGQVNAIEPTVTPSPQAASEPAAQTPTPQAPSRPQKRASFIKVALFGLVLLGAFSVVWFALKSASLQGSSDGESVPLSVNADIKATPHGAQIFIDGQYIGQSQVQAQLSKGAHTVSASLAGYDSQTVPFEVDSDPKALQIDLRPVLLDLHVVTDRPGGVVWIDDVLSGEITESGVTISAIEPGNRLVRISTPAGDVEMSFEFVPGQLPAPVSLPSRQLADVLFVASSDAKARVECNCVPAGLRVGDRAELMRASELEMPLVEGQHKAELWIGKKHRNLTVQGSRSPVVTIGVFSMSSIPNP